MKRTFRKYPSNYVNASRKIRANSNSSISKYRIKWLDSDYTGGNVDVVWGQLTNGSYFCASSLNYDVFIVDENPGEQHNGEYDGFIYGDDYNWLQEHSVVDLSEQEMCEFWIYLIRYCQRKGIQMPTYDSPYETIKELKEYLNG